MTDITQDLGNLGLILLVVVLEVLFQIKVDRLIRPVVGDSISPG